MRWKLFKTANPYIFTSKFYDLPENDRIRQK